MILEIFLASGSSAPVRLSMEVMQLLGSQGPWQSQACRDTDCLSHRSYDPIRVFSNLWQLAIRRPFWLVPLCCLAHSGKALKELS